MTTFYKDPQLKEPEKEIKMRHQTHSGGFSFDRNITEKNRYSADEMTYEYSYVKSKQVILDWTKCTINELHIIIPLKPHTYQVVKNFILPVESDPTKSFNVTLDVGKNLNISVKNCNFSIFDYVIVYKKLIAFLSFLGITRFMRKIRNNYYIHAHMLSDDNRYYLHKMLPQSMCSVVHFEDIINLVSESYWSKWLSIYSRMFHLNMDLINVAYENLMNKTPIWNEHIWYSRIFDFFEIGFRALIKISTLPTSNSYRKKFYELEKRYLLKSSLLRQCSGIDLEHFECHKSKESSKKVVRDDYDKIIELAVSIRNYHRHGYFDDSKKSLEGWLDLYSERALIDLGNYLYSVIWLSLIKEFNSTMSFNIVLQDFESYSINLEDIRPYFIYDYMFSSSIDLYDTFLKNT